MKQLGSIRSVVVLLCVAVPAVADSILYSNGPTNGTVNAWSISQGTRVTNSFVLSHSEDLETVSLGWDVPTEGVPATLEFFISTTPFGTDLGGGKVTLSGQFLFTNSSGLNVYEASFSFPQH